MTPVVLRMMAGALAMLFALAAGQDVRGLGMGRLTLVLESEVKPFDMHGFGENPAGLYRSKLPCTASGDSTTAARTSVLELYAPGCVWRYAGEPPYEWAIGNPLPSQFQECFPQYMTGIVDMSGWYHLTGDWIPYVPFASRPSGALWRYRSTFAFAVKGAWSYATFNGSPFRINTQELDVAAAVPLGRLDIGLELPASLVNDTFYVREQFAFVGYRLGVVVPLRMMELGAVVSADWPHAFADIPPIVSGWISTGRREDYSLQAMLRPVDWLKLGAAGGHRKASTGAVFTSPWAGLRAECRPKNLPFLSGFEAEWARLRTHQPTHEIDQMDSVGVGAGLGVRLAPLLAGAELHFAQRTHPEDTGAVLKPNLITNYGAELNLGKAQVRLGFLHSVRPVRIAPGTGFNTYTGTAGFGFDFASLRADVAWNHTYRPVGPEIEDEVHLDLKRGW
jgi:hypothetical protein